MNDILKGWASEEPVTQLDLTIAADDLGTAIQERRKKEEEVRVARSNENTARLKPETLQETFKSQSV
jgi:hypothetical protein